MGKYAQQEEGDENSEGQQRGELFSHRPIVPPLGPFAAPPRAASSRADAFDDFLIPITRGLRLIWVLGYPVSRPLIPIRNTTDPLATTPAAAL